SQPRQQLHLAFQGHLDRGSDRGTGADLSGAQDQQRELSGHRGLADDQPHLRRHLHPDRPRAASARKALSPLLRQAVQSFDLILSAAAPGLLQGFLITIGVSAAAVAAGAILGIAFGLALTYGGRLLAFPFRVVVDVVRGTPVLVLIFAAFYMP